MGADELKGTPDRAICASYTYTPTLPSNGALPGHTTFHLYHHPYKADSTSYFLMQTIPVPPGTDKKQHLALLSDINSTGLSFSSRRHGGWTSEFVHFYRGPNPENPQSVTHRATIGDIHGGGFLKWFNLRKEIAFEPAVKYPDNKCYNYETPGGKVHLEEESKNWGTETYYNFKTPKTQTPLFWRTTEVSTPDPTRPEKNERDRWTMEGHLSCTAQVAKTIKGEGLRREEDKGIVVARFVKPIDHTEKKVYHKMGRIELVWEGCERVWGPEWDRQDIIESILCTAFLVVMKRAGDETKTVPVPAVV